MFRSTLLIGVLGFGGLFGYYFLRDRTAADATGRARSAAGQVSGTVVSEGIEGLVNARLLAKFGYEQVAFLHTHFTEGKVVVYGLAPAQISADALRAEAQGTPGVKEVEVLIGVRPDYVKTIFAGDAVPASAPPAASASAP